MIDEDLPRRPPVPCPKCGYRFGFLHAKPTYKTLTVDLKRREWLDWECSTCGYLVATEVAS